MIHVCENKMLCSCKHYYFINKKNNIIHCLLLTEMKNFFVYKKVTLHSCKHNIILLIK